VSSIILLHKRQRIAYSLDMTILDVIVGVLVVVALMTGGLMWYGLKISGELDDEK
jgi:hypothetical protein